MNGTITVPDGSANNQEFEKAISTFSIYPNPGNNEININISSLDNNSLALEVFDILGKKVYTKVINKLNTKINTSKWNSGLYLMRISSDQNIKSTKRFIKL